MPCRSSGPQDKQSRPARSFTPGGSRSSCCVSRLLVHRTAGTSAAITNAGAGSAAVAAIGTARAAFAAIQRTRRLRSRSAHGGTQQAANRQRGQNEKAIELGHGKILRTRRMICTPPSTSRTDGTSTPQLPCMGRRDCGRAKNHVNQRHNRTFTEGCGMIPVTVLGGETKSADGAATNSIVADKPHPVGPSNRTRLVGTGVTGTGRDRSHCGHSWQLRRTGGVATTPGRTEAQHDLVQPSS